MRRLISKITMSGALATMSVTAIGLAAPAGAADKPVPKAVSNLVSCTITPSTADWYSDSPVPQATLTGTPALGNSTMAMLANGTAFNNTWGSPSPAPANGTNVLDGATYADAMTVLGGEDGTIEVALYGPSATSAADPSLCSFVVTVHASAMPTTTTTTTASTTTTAEGLPNTGGTNLWLVGLGGLLVASGALVLGATRRTRKI